MKDKLPFSNQILLKVFTVFSEKGFFSLLIFSKFLNSNVLWYSILLIYSFCPVGKWRPAQETNKTKNTSNYVNTQPVLWKWNRHFLSSILKKAANVMFQRYLAFITFSNITYTHIYFHAYVINSQLKSEKYYTIRQKSRRCSNIFSFSKNFRV